MLPSNRSATSAAGIRDIGHTDGRFVAVPLGGIGTGNLAIASDGGLRQWQLHNIGNHRGDLPGTFFALRVSRIEPPTDVVRVLQAPLPKGTQPSTPLVDDDAVPIWQGELLDRHRGVDATTMRCTYPFAEVTYHDAEWPVSVQLEAFNPFVPLDVEASALPAALFTFRVTNRDDVAVHGWLGASLQNAIGGDGVSPIRNVEGLGYGGNTNRLVREAAWTSLVMENLSLPSDHPGAGQMVLAADHPAAPALPQWTHADEFMAFLASRAPIDSAARLLRSPHRADPQRNSPASAFGPSAPGRTWNGGLAVPFTLSPGETREIRVVIAWHLPNRYLNFEQFGPPHPEYGPTRFWLGNAYSRRFSDATEVLRTVAGDWERLRSDSRAWVETLQRATGLATIGPRETVVEHLAAQPVPLRTPTCFQTADGKFFGFEGVLGRSTAMWNGDVGGSCPLNCTHVWNYEQTLAALFPSLERDMRDTEFDVLQAPSGAIPHRVIVPTYLPQLWDVPIGGPDEPALDGMLGTVLKSYREVRRGSGVEWLERRWEGITRLMDHIRGSWDPEGTGLLRGIQPSTHDIDLAGVNSFMGTLWLAALRAEQEMARLLGDGDREKSADDLFQRGSAAYDEQLFNGEYYVQRLDANDPQEFQWGPGCLADQLIGQWWAHELDLGHVLPADHVRTALRSIVRYNLRQGFSDFSHGYRVFADQDDTGLLMCTWPQDGRPEVPTRYADEVWTGTEYQVAAHCFYEGLVEEGRAILDGLWRRYDGSRRNPYNEIECGDHYARAMAGWSLVNAAGALAFDATRRVVTAGMNRGGAGVLPLILDSGWGEIEVLGHDDEDTGELSVTLRCTRGTFDLRAVRLRDEGATVDISVPGPITAGNEVRLTAALRP